MSNIFGAIDGIILCTLATVVGCGIDKAWKLFQGTK